MVDHRGNGVSIPTFSVPSDNFTLSNVSEASANKTAAKAEMVRSLVTRLQRRAHEIYVDCNYGPETQPLPAPLYRHVNQLKDDADILLMLIDGTEPPDVEQR